MPGLSREIVEHRLPIQKGFKPFKQPARRFEPSIVLQIKNEIENLLKAGFIRAARYVDWVSNIVPVRKKNGKLRVCIDFRNLNLATPKDEYPMPIADMLVDSAAGNEILSFMDGHAGYNQIYIAEEDVAKTAFRCPGSIGTFEWKKVQELMKEMLSVTLERVSRTVNGKADALARLAKELADPDLDEVHVTIKNRKILSPANLNPEEESKEIQKANTLNIEVEDDWRESFINYFKYNELPKEKPKQVQLKKRAMRFAFVNNTLYRRSYD
uniref:Reverse transcriptase domain-containing protein n=1 Tax=Ananas comosus var. bracteatus TaxID=296719 RepID=A0A6V7Q9D7_ANACO|nr:unnamed protein product [Ananas comosus var. bracteatus]